MLPVASHFPVSGFFTYCPSVTGAFVGGVGTVSAFALPPFRLASPFLNPSKAFLLVIAPPVKIAPPSIFGFVHLPVSGSFTYPPVSGLLTCGAFTSGAFVSGFTGSGTFISGTFGVSGPSTTSGVLFPGVAPKGISGFTGSGTFISGTFGIFGLSLGITTSGLGILNSGVFPPSLSAAFFLLLPFPAGMLPVIPNVPPPFVISLSTVKLLFISLLIPSSLLSPVFLFPFTVESPPIVTFPTPIVPFDVTSLSTTSPTSP